MKRTIRAFSLGLFSAGLIIIAVILINGETSVSRMNAEELPLEEMIDIMKEEGYRVVTEEEYISISVTDQDGQANTDEQETADQNEDEDENKEDSEEGEIEKYTLPIKEGMASSEIGELLEENNIIESSSDFNKYLIDEGFHQRVQLGEFEVTSDMDFKAIAEEITR